MREYISKRIILRGCPISTNQLYKRHGNFIYMTREGKDVKETYQWSAKTQWKEKLTKNPINIFIKLYFMDKRRHDIDNYNKILLDALNGIVWEDDNQIKKMEIEKFVDKENPRIEICISVDN